ncbi:MAG: hypothetical protein MI924_00295 [Chloroflexales bacterium]|nr:hypothetical protein [Chloroflexales bacterium]
MWAQAFLAVIRGALGAVAAPKKGPLTPATSGRMARFKARGGLLGA